MPRAAGARSGERPVVRVVTFAAFGLYGTLRWSELLSPAPTWRLLAVLGVAVLVVAIGTALEGRPRWLVAMAGVLGALAIFALAGVPAEWIRHVRLSVGANAVGQGISALPNALVPYLGINHWVRVVIILGAGVLLLDAALLVAFAPRSPGDVRRAAAALPLIALAIVPTTLVRPGIAYVHGLILFGLLAAFIWAERAPTRDGFTAMVVIAAAGIGGMIAAPVLKQQKAWVDYESLAQKLAVGHVDQFNWLQGYGPLRWPTRDETVLDVQAAHAEYWKAEDLDVFKGTGWAQGSYGPAPPASAVSEAARRQWTQPIQVTLRSMRTTNVIAAGVADTPPSHLAQGVMPGVGSGTWTTGAPLQPGDSYRISTYAPNPTPRQLAAAGTDYPHELVPTSLAIQLPGFNYRGDYNGSQTALPAPFGSNGSIAFGRSSAAAAWFIGSPYAGAYRLAVRLSHGASTPYAYIERVMAYLKSGRYTYDTNVPARKYPLEAFLINTRVGYCQQFAGAMALLLRIAGIPSQVAVGFTTGSYDTATKEYVVSDTDAHSWVEAWFPSYGWVRFDPTPSSTLVTSATAPNNRSGTGPGLHRIAPHKSLAVPAGNSSVHAEGTAVAPWLAILAALVLVTLVVAAVSRRAALALTGPGERLVAELERAMRRTGRPVADGVTLAALEQRFSASGHAVGYVRAVRLARYGGGDSGPTKEERRALRRQLAAGLGLLGRLRALWALPPHLPGMPSN
jgi:transglutaminase-like putative cysteine protease